MHVIVHDSTSEQQQKLNIKSFSDVAALVCFHFGQAVVIHWQPSLYLPHIL